MKLSTRARYGTRILVDLALHGDSRMSLREITERQQVSRSYLDHLIAPLVEAGIIGSARGFRGGIWLARPLNRVRLSEVVKLLEGNELLVECIGNPGKCGRAEWCATRSIWEMVGRAIFRVLDSVTLQDLVNQQGKKVDAACPDEF